MLKLHLIVLWVLCLQNFRVMVKMSDKSSTMSVKNSIELMLYVVLTMPTLNKAYLFIYLLFIFIFIYGPMCN
jgi:hypothetical protein